MMMMNLTPQKQNYNENNQQMKEKIKKIKKTGEKIPQKEQVIEESQEISKWKCLKMSYKKLIILLLIVIIPVLTVIVIFSIVAFSKAQNEDVMVIYKDFMRTGLKSGQNFISSSLELQTPDKQFVTLSINQIDQKKRLLQVSTFSSLLKVISYYHKNTQISISIDDAFRIQIQIPGDTGLDFVIGDINNDCLKQLQKLPIQLPLTFKQILEKLTKKKVSVSTCVAYDGVFNNKTNDYTLLNQRKSYHPESFLRIKPREMDLIGSKPKIENCNSIFDISNTITSVISTLISNFSKLIQSKKNSIKQYSENPQKIDTKRTITPNEQVKRCTRVGKDLLRCCEDTWSQFKVTNLGESKPLQVNQIIINIE